MDGQIPAWVNGVLTPVGKLEAHQKALRHKAVSVFAIAGGKVLMQQRALSKYHTPGLWTNTCCTHPHWDEDPLDCAIRRLDEELGISGTRPQHRHMLEYRACVGGGLVEHEVVDIFVIKTDAPMAVKPNPEEVMSVAWMDLATLQRRVAEDPALFTPWLRIYLKDHADMIFGADLSA